MEFPEIIEYDHGYIWPEIDYQGPPIDWYEANKGRFNGFSADHILESAVPVAGLVPPNRCGIYFLILGDQIVYVGKSNDILRRYGQHTFEGVKQFDRFWCFTGVPKMFINYIEQHYIKLFKPAYNINDVAD